MNARAILIAIFSLAIIAGAPDASAQSFRDKLKKATEKIGQQVKQSVSQKTQKKSENDSNQDNELQKRVDVTVGANNNKNIEDEAPTVRLPKTHTALFAPLGYPAEATYGIKSAKPVMPPKSADAQADWSEKLPNIYELDNQSLVAEFQMLDKLVAEGYIQPLTPANWRYNEIVKRELSARAEALNEMVQTIKEAMEEYNTADSHNWVINNIHRKFAEILDGRAYKTIIRSSITPLFTLKEKFITDDTKEYFNAHGGYENATTATWTVWNPKPNRENISTSMPGQTGNVIDENESGATIDLEGVVYILHNKNGKPLDAFISEAVKTAVAGKDIEIPDNIMYKGGKYPVRKMRSDIFSGTTVKSVKLPSTLHEISNNAFRETPITEIIIPASVKKIQGSAFYGCSKLTKVIFEGDYIEEINGCFQNCTSLESVRFPRRVGKMSYDMFKGCLNLTEVILPENLSEIYPSMFSGCKNLKSVDVPSSVTKVGKNAFYNSGITSLDLSNVKEFGALCFSGCKALKTVKLSSDLKDNFLTEIYQEFMSCPLLEVKYINDEYVFPDGLIFIDNK